MGKRTVQIDVDGDIVEVPRKNTRRTRNGGLPEHIKERAVDATRQNRPPLRPMNEKQRQYISAVQNESFVICVGVWGSSKTFIPSMIAADMLLDKKVDRIIIARPAEGKGKSIGFLKGDKNDKLEPWCAPITDTLKTRLGLGNYEAFINNGKIELLSLEHVKGRSWDNAFILVDEAEDLEPEVAKSLVGRQGVNSKLVVTGDIMQQDLKKNSGLEFLLDVAEFAKLPITLINFDSWEYCVRSEEAKMWGMAFQEYEKSKGGK
jgi:phosphate starvation-inducible PhoH-like protein